MYHSQHFIAFSFANSVAASINFLSIDDLSKQLRQTFTSTQQKWWNGMIVYTAKIRKNYHAVIIYDLYNQQQKAFIPLRYKESPPQVIQLRDGNILCGISGNELRIWNKNGECLQTLVSSNLCGARALLELENGDIVIGGFNSIIVWNKVSIVNVVRTGMGTYLSFCQLRNGTLVYGNGSEVHFLDRNYDEIRYLRCGGEVMACIPLNGDKLFTISNAGNMFIWNTRNFEVLYRSGEKYNRVHSGRRLRNNTCLLCMNNTIVVVDSNGNTLATYSNIINSRESMSIVELVPGIVAYQQDQSLILLDIRTGTKIQEFTIPCVAEENDVFLNCFLT
jgi:hypothetical protein